MAFVDFLSALHTSKTRLKSFLTVFKRFERTSHSLSRNLKSGFLTKDPTLLSVFRVDGSNLL